MKLVQIALISLLLLLSNVVFSQKELEVDGVKYLVHFVSKKETVFSICQKYQVSLGELQQANPGLGSVLQAGTTIRIPVGGEKPAEKETKAKVKSQAETDYYYHKTTAKQTIYSIAKQYGITPNELIRYNPELSAGLQIGQVLKIPVVQSGEPLAPANVSSVISQPPATETGYKMHTVVSGETIYSLVRYYGLNPNELTKHNPELQNGLKTGMKLKIPVKKIEPVYSEKDFFKHQVSKGETLFSLAARFGVDADDLKTINPALYSRSLEIGETILVPKQLRQVNDSQSNPNSELANRQSTDNADCQPLKRNFQKYKVALLLPFYLPAESGAGKAQLTGKLKLNSPVSGNFSDTLMSINGVTIDQKAIGFLEFYEGALLAVDSLQRAGMNIELYVFDSGTQQKINTLLQLDEFRELDLIIGPVYPEFQTTVAAFAAKNRIPMVSPLSSAGTFEDTNPYYIKINSSREFQIEQTASYIANTFRNNRIFVLKPSGSSNSPEAKLADLSKQKIIARTGRNPIQEYSIQQGTRDLRPLLSTTEENIFIIPTDNEAQVSVAVTNLNALAEHYPIVLMGTPAFTKLKSIQVENYHRIRLRYLNSNFIDYTKPLVKRFIGQYRETFSGEPSQFSFQGFDVSFYFLSALRQFGKDFRNCLYQYPMELTQIDFNFRKQNQMGGYLNQGLFVTAFERNFDVLNYGTFDGLINKLAK